MNIRSFIFFTRILARAQISSLIFRGLFYWGFIGHNFGDYKNHRGPVHWPIPVLSVTILETTKTPFPHGTGSLWFYRSQFWRLQKPNNLATTLPSSFIGHNFGDYKNRSKELYQLGLVLSVTILETTKTLQKVHFRCKKFYRSQFWRLQKPQIVSASYTIKVRIYSAWKVE